MRPEPTVPISIAEMLCVTLSVAQQSGRLDRRTQENLGIILDAYRSRRDKWVRDQGYSPEDVAAYVAATAESLANWLDDRAVKADIEDGEFDEFEKDFNERKEENRHQASPTHRKRIRHRDNRTGGVGPDAPAGGGWSADGGATDPGGQKPTE